MKQAVILAGGKGTRLSERLGNLPKPLVDICGIPLLERQIQLILKYGFESVLILINHRAEDIIKFCKTKDNWGIKIQCIDDGTPKGTAGAVLQAFNFLDTEFLLMYGDIMLNVDIRRFHQYHLTEQEAAATLFLHPNDHPHDSDLVDVDEHGYITNFHPYPHDSTRYYQNLVNAGLYWVRKFSLEKWRDSSNGVLDFGKHLFPAMLNSGQKLRGYNSPEYIKDCGTPARLDKVCADFLSGKIQLSSFDHKQRAVFIDRDGTINEEVDHLISVDQLKLLPNVGQAIRRLNHSGYRICVVTNQPVIARGECSLDNLKQIHNKLETLLGCEGAYVDRIYYCPHHPEKGFPGEIPELKIDCECRKPKPGLIDSAVVELNISRGDSWMIGDTTADMLAAQRAGLKSILVETGYAGLEQKYWVTPDFIVPNLDAGVSFILDVYPRLIQSISPLTQNIRPGDLVFVGGQSRSGKSTFASALRDVLQSRGLRSHILTTDRWLLSVRSRGKNVLTRHDVENLNNLLKIINNSRLRPVRFKLPGYKKSTREHLPEIESFDFMEGDVVIFEGVVALHFAHLINAKHCFFVEIEEELRKERIIREYLLRGFSLEEADTIYRERLLEEVPWVDSTSYHSLKVSIPFASNNYGKE